MYRSRFRRIVGSLLLLALGACDARDTPDAPRADVVVDRDDYGNVVESGSTTNPARIISLNPATTELLFALGAGGRLVGRTHWDLYPDSARLVPDLGPGIRPDVEALLTRKPDLVVLYGSEDNRAAAQRLAAFGVKVVALKLDRIDDFRRAARLLGRATGLGDRARTVIDTVDATLARVRQATDTLPDVPVFWHIWDNPLITIGSGSFMTELVAISGGRNVYADDAKPSPQITLEDVVRRDPAVVLAGPVGARLIRRTPAWSAVPAVRAGRVLIVDTMLVSRASVRLGEAAVSLATLLHPGLKP
ncbi:MAG TPA: helical backbone metal receptor [Gemmatimonadaceae bacterium]|nr:helical backbone metal receptor [Gemmatimonadaceae bacterium]